MGARLDVGAECLQIALPVGFVLGIELQDPGLLLQFVEAVLQGVLQSIAHVAQPARLASLGADGGELEERRHRLAVLQQQALRLGQELDPGQ